MRLLPPCCFLLLLTPARAEPPVDVPPDPRAWKGTIEVRAVGKAGADGSGLEEQVETAEWILVTEARRWVGAPTRHEILVKSATGSWSLEVQRKEARRHATGLVSEKGSGSGRLHLRARGWIDSSKRTFRLDLSGTPATLTAKITRSGIVDGKLQTFRTVLARRAILTNFRTQGPMEDARTIRGTYSFKEKQGGRTRDVNVSWKFERLDPVVQGRIIDAEGRPVAGVTVQARTTNRPRIQAGLSPFLRSGETDAAGRFRLEAFPAVWEVKILGRRIETTQGVLLVAGKRIANAADIRFESVPDLEISTDLYRLAHLPRPDALRRSFHDHVDAYLRWVTERYPAAVLARARVR